MTGVIDPRSFFISYKTVFTHNIIYLCKIRFHRFYSNVLCIVPDRVDKVEPALCWWTPEELKETQRQLVSDLIQTNLGYNALLHCRGVLSIEITSAMNDFYNLTF